MECKVVYEDNNQSKVIKGEFISEDEFTITIKPLYSNKLITVGKSSLIQLTRGESNE